MSVYKPREDSLFMLDCVEQIINKISPKQVLEIGTGSGIISISIADKLEEILATDIDQNAIETAKKNAKEIPNIEFRISDLFENIDRKFDLIFFNPPYLPGKRDPTISGGEKGNEIIERYLNQVKDYLKEDGEALVLMSSLNNIQELKNKHHLHQIAKMELFFETLYCFIILGEGNPFLQEGGEFAHFTSIILVLDLDIRLSFLTWIE